MAALRLTMAPGEDVAALRFPMCIGMAPRAETMRVRRKRRCELLFLSAFGTVGVEGSAVLRRAE